jgi:hypothetical protein
LCTPVKNQASKRIKITKHQKMVQDCSLE